MLSLYAYSQEKELHLIDSLKQVNSKLSNTNELIDNCNEIAIHYGSLNIDSSLYYSSKAKKIATDIDYKKGLATSYSYSARAYIDKSEFKLAISNFHEALNLFKNLNDSINILDTYRGLGYVASFSASQLKTLNYNLSALNYAEQLKDTTSISIILNNIGSIYKKLNDYESSLRYFTKAMEFVPKDNIDDIALAHSNIGVLKIENGKTEAAINNYHELLKIMPKVQSSYLLAYFQLSIAGYYNAINDFKSSRYYFDKAFKISDSLNYQHIKVRLLRKEAEMYLKQKKYRNCVINFNKCIALSNKLGIREEFPRIYKMRAQAYFNLNQPAKAYASSMQAINFTDSLQLSKVSGFLDEFEEQRTKDEMERLQLQEALKDQQIENGAYKMKVRSWLAFIAIVLLILIICLIAYSFFKSKKKNKILTSQHATIKQQKLLLEENIQKLKVSEINLKKLNATKDKFFSIISHDLKSPFNSIIGFSSELSDYYDSYDNKERKTMIDMIKDTSQATLTLLENLLSWSQSQSGHIKLKPESYKLKSLIKNGISAYLGSADIKNIKVTNNINKDINVFTDKETVKIIISNLFNNAIKYSKNGGEITLSSKNIQNQKIEVCIADSGIGMNESILKGLFNIEDNVSRPGTAEEKGTGLGLILCKEFITKNGGEIRVESVVDKGSKFYFTLPINKA
ncbi:tetratricopeptide repeat-containing sensor histidine kinase [Marinifilum sp. RC60d5]|uniref:tetratricopeptide repeat-containing sensor histidine kinase n=1 Tax=Marinifilum sp. RC60d5 TaxID=3458414 RepID=UPI004035311E